MNRRPTALLPALCLGLAALTGCATLPAASFHLSEEGTARLVYAWPAESKPDQLLWERVGKELKWPQVGKPHDGQQTLAVEFKEERRLADSEVLRRLGKATEPRPADPFGLAALDTLGNLR